MLNVEGIDVIGPGQDIVSAVAELLDDGILGDFIREIEALSVFDQSENKLDSGSVPPEFDKLLNTGNSPLHPVDDLLENSLYIFIGSVDEALLAAGAGSLDGTFPEVTEGLGNSEWRLFVRLTEGSHHRFSNGLGSWDIVAVSSIICEIVESEEPENEVVAVSKTLHEDSQSDIQVSPGD